MWRKYCRLAGLHFEHAQIPNSPQTPNCRLLAYDPGVMDAKHVLERVAILKQEMQDWRVENARLDEPRHSRGGQEARLSRLEQFKTELAEIIGQFKRTGTD